MPEKMKVYIVGKGFQQVDKAETPTEKAKRIRKERKAEVPKEPEPDFVPVAPAAEVEADLKAFIAEASPISNSVARQQWLEAGLNFLRQRLKAQGASLPAKLRLSIGFPFGSRKAIGQAWYEDASTDGHAEIFVSPVISDSSRLLDVLLHELCHACLGKGKGHGKEFRALATRVGLTGKMTATVASEELEADLAAYIKEAGEYPAGGIDIATSERKKQTTRMRKCECPSCGYVARTTAKWIEQAGAPLCPDENCDQYREPMQGA